MSGDGESRPNETTVVVAVITCDLGVLLGRRRDQSPPWTFPGGKAELGESPAQTVVREVHEETGLSVTVHGELGRRVHPVTRRAMIYLACTPSGGVDVVADGRELVELRWVRWPDLDAHMPHLFGPVRAHLRGRLDWSRT